MPIKDIKLPSMQFNQPLLIFRRVLEPCGKIMVFQKRELDKQCLQLEVLINVSYIYIKMVSRNILRIEVICLLM